MSKLIPTLEKLALRQDIALQGTGQTATGSLPLVPERAQAPPAAAVLVRGAQPPRTAQELALGEALRHHEDESGGFSPSNMKYAPPFREQMCPTLFVKCLTH